MIVGKDDLKKEEEEDITNLPNTPKREALEMLMKEFGGTRYLTLALKDMRDRSVSLLEEKMTRDGAFDIVVNINKKKTKEALLMFLTEELFK
jgi:hypothetical protein